MSKIENAIERLSKAYLALTKAYEREGGTLTPSQHAHVIAHVLRLMQTARLACDTAHKLGAASAGKFSLADLGDEPPVTVTQIGDTTITVATSMVPPAQRAPQAPAGLVPIGWDVNTKQPIYGPPEERLDAIKQSKGKKDIGFLDPNEAASENNIAVETDPELETPAIDGDGFTNDT